MICNKCFWKGNCSLKPLKNCPCFTTLKKLVKQGLMPKNNTLEGNSNLVSSYFKGQLTS